MMALAKLAADSPGAETMRQACFGVITAIDPGALPRVMEAFAKRGLVPASVYVRRFSEQQSLHIDIQVEASQQHCMTIADQLRSLPVVQCVVESLS